jgi:hypothetical protein
LSFWPSLGPPCWEQVQQPLGTHQRGGACEVYYLSLAGKAPPCPGLPGAGWLRRGLFFFFAGGGEIHYVQPPGHQVALGSVGLLAMVVGASLPTKTPPRILS